MKYLFLFDMDGTLTPPRKKMDFRIENMLAKIQKQGHEIGIITGSDMNYITQQCAVILDLSNVQPLDIHFLPCNGTKYSYRDKEIYVSNMREKYSRDKWNSLIKYLIKCQLEIVERYDIPLSGHFIDYRDSMINWCPIGRNANSDDRKAFEFKNNALSHESLRMQYIRRLRDFLLFKEMDITIKLGGDTSFDIYPTGWDKAYPIEKGIFDEYNIYFIGDRCNQSGNDFEIYNHPKVHGYKTESPEQTVEIVNKILLTIV